MMSTLSCPEVIRSLERYYTTCDYKLKRLLNEDVKKQTIKNRLLFSQYSFVQLFLYTGYVYEMIIPFLLR